MPLENVRPAAERHQQAGLEPISITSSPPVSTETKPASIGPDVRSAAASYLKLGLRVIPIPPRSKGPTIIGWPGRVFGLADFEANSNIGVKLGFEGLCDVDLDSPEALIVAPLFLPETGFRFGRASSRASHSFYSCDPPVTTLKLLDPMIGALGTLIELRGLKRDGNIGFHSVVPGSVHLSGELIEFEPGANHCIGNVGAGVLVEAVHRIAAAALLARYFPAARSGRNDAFLCIAGMLARAGWLIEDAVTFAWAIYRILWQQAADRTACEAEVTATFQKWKAGENITGIPHLKKLVKREAVDAVVRWLAIDTRHSAAADASAAVPWPTLSRTWTAIAQRPTGRSWQTAALDLNHREIGFRPSRKYRFCAMSSARISAGSSKESSLPGL